MYAASPSGFGCHLGEGVASLSEPEENDMRAFKAGYEQRIVIEDLSRDGNPNAAGQKGTVDGVCGVERVRSSRSPQWDERSC